MLGRVINKLWPKKLAKRQKMSTYDENINKNKFYKFLIKNYFDLLKKASEDNLIVCIPSQYNNFTNITETDILEHIIIPSKIDKTCRTLNNTEVQISRDELRVYREYLGEYYDIKILIKETMYLKGMKLNLYCTNNFLNRSTFNSIMCINNLRDSIDFLWEICSGKKLLVYIDKSCSNFLTQNKILHSDKYELKDKLDHLYFTFFEEALILRNDFIDSDFLFDQVKLSVGTYTQHCLLGKVFEAACYNSSKEDIIINMELRKYAFKRIYPGIKQFSSVIIKAKSELSKINSYSTCLGKLSCLKSVYNILNSAENIEMDTRMFFELLIFLISKVNINNWFGNFTYLRLYGFGLEDNGNINNFLITQLEAVLKHIRDNKIIVTIDDIIDINTSDRTCVLFRAIYANDINMIKVLVQDILFVSTISMCHPLCNCDRCKKLLSKTNILTNICDKLGRNCLHIACIFGHTSVIDYFIQEGIDLNKDDSFGCSPLHYAAAFGNQEALLLLLKAKADLNYQNFEGNTALHLAADFGQQTCVETILIYAQTNKINVSDCVNHEGNSALHLASQRNYEPISTLLAKNNFDVGLRNNSNKLAFDLTTCVCLKLYLNDFNSFISEGVYSEDFSYTDNTNTHFFGIKPISTDQIKKTDLLLKAVENNDLPLTCFYLGINDDKRSKKICHPLCNCKNCDLLYQEAKSKENNKSILDVNICNMDGFTAMHYAAKFGRKEICFILLKAGADINVLTYKSLYSPLHIACINEQVVTGKELMKVDTCDVNMQDFQGNTALHYAVINNNAKLVEALIARGCNFKIKNCNYRTALDEAVDKSYFDIIMLINDAEMLEPLF